MVESSALKSSIEYSPDSHFPLENLPFGCFVNPNENATRCCTRIGNTIVDLSILEHAKIFNGPVMGALSYHVFCEETLNKFMALGKNARIEVRETLQAVFAAGNEVTIPSEALFDCTKVEMRMPVFIRDYTDFYSSKNHAYNVGVMFRGPENALQPNWTHLPVGYHGRASSVVVSGTPIRRPCGQVSADGKTPTFSDCKRLDLELEMGTFISTPNKLGDPIPIGEARDHIFGFCLLNDWSARDLQKWEYVPLGPFNAKNFASTISPWVITPEALAPFKVALPEQDPAMLPYLKDEDLSSYNVSLDILIKTP